jgi:NAD(P)-dependent dehydrogenase (short-subunit alcohol dehydrogenase family)
MTDTSEQVALVTGANRGIGLEVTRQLAALGFNVILGSRAPAKGEEAARRMVADGLKVIPRRLDVTDQKSINELKSWVEERFGGLDVLVNNAAILYDSWQRQCVERERLARVDGRRDSCLQRLEGRAERAHAHALR